MGLLPINSSAQFPADFRELVDVLLSFTGHFNVSWFEVYSHTET